MRFDFFSLCCVCVFFLLSVVAIFRLVDEKKDENKIPNYCIIYLHFQPNQWVSNRIFSWLYGRKTFFTELIAIVSLWKFQHFKSFEHHSSLAHLSQLGIFFMPTKLLSLMCMYVHLYIHIMFETDIVFQCAHISNVRDERGKGIQVN